MNRVDENLQKLFVESALNKLTKKLKIKLISNKVCVYDRSRWPKV